MKTLVKITIAMMALLFGCIGSACIPKRPVHRTHTVEFRLAESEMSDGLVEQTVGNSGEKIYLHKEAVVAGDDIGSAEAAPDGRGTYTLNVRFSADAAIKIGRATEENISKRLAILIDGKVLSAPFIQSSISNSCSITGRFTKEVAEGAANAINGN
jgi:preprotein translocase subunit SecD